jgi:hypothetical protein
VIFTPLGVTVELESEGDKVGTSVELIAEGASVTLPRRVGAKLFGKREGANVSFAKEGAVDGTLEAFPIEGAAVALRLINVGSFVVATGDTEGEAVPFDSVVGDDVTFVRDTVGDGDEKLPPGVGASVVALLAVGDSVAFTSPAKDGAKDSDAFPGARLGTPDVALTKLGGTEPNKEGDSEGICEALTNTGGAVMLTRLGGWLANVVSFAKVGAVVVVKFVREGAMDGLVSVTLPKDGAAVAFFDMEGANVVVLPTSDGAGVAVKLDKNGIMVGALLEAFAVGKGLVTFPSVGGNVEKSVAVGPLEGTSVVLVLSSGFGASVVFDDMVPEGGRVDTARGLGEALVSLDKTDSANAVAEEKALAPA